MTSSQVSHIDRRPQNWIESKSYFADFLISANTLLLSKSHCNIISWWSDIYESIVTKKIKCHFYIILYCRSQSDSLIYFTRVMQLHWHYLELIQWVTHFNPKAYTGIGFLRMMNAFCRPFLKVSLRVFKKVPALHCISPVSFVMYYTKAS